MYDESAVSSDPKVNVQRGYGDVLKMLPTECKSDAQDEKTKFIINVKEEPFYAFDISSRDSFEEDFEANRTSCITSNSMSSVPCVCCGFTFPSVKQMWIHRLACHTDKVHICRACEDRYEFKHAFNNHNVSHQIDELNPCEICGSQLFKSMGSQKHLVNLQNERPLKCTYCGAYFQRHSSLANHIKIHSYSPGRALLSPANSSSCNVINPTQTISSSDTSWDSKEPIPSFETLPSPSFSYQHPFNKSTINSKMNSQNRTLSPSSSDLNVSSIDSVPLGLFSYQEHEDTQNKMAYVERSASVTVIPPSSLLENPALKTQVPLSSNQDTGRSQDTHVGVSSYLHAKQMKSLYGIKKEESLLSAQAQAMNTRCFQPLQTLSIASNDCANEHTGANLLSIQASSPLTCSKCEFSCSSVEEFQSHTCLPFTQWKRSSSPNLSSQSQANESFVYNESSASKNMIAMLSADSSCQNLSKSSSATQGTISQNKSTLKHCCVECNKKFATKQKLFRHMWIHRKKQFTCETCGAVFADRVALGRHRLALHPPSFTAPFVCNECGKTFASRQSLWEHGRVHGNLGSGGASLLWCQECNKSFASRQGYQIHIRTHTGERPYGCRYCFKSFRDGGTLRKHERIHTGERPHACPLCSRAFNQKVVLREHVRWVHAATHPEPPFRCQLCNTQLSDREELCVHIVKHSDDLAAMVRAAAKDIGNKLPRNISLAVGSQGQNKVGTPVNSEIGNPDLNCSHTPGIAWTEDYHKRKEATFPKSNPAVPLPMSLGENFGGKQTSSTSLSNKASECCSFSSINTNNEYEGAGPSSNSFSRLNVSSGIEQGTSFQACNVSGQVPFESIDTLMCSSFNVLSQGKGLIKNPKSHDYDRCDIKQEISLRDAFSSSVCELSQARLPCQSSFAEQVVINV